MGRRRRFEELVKKSHTVGIQIIKKSKELEENELPDEFREFINHEIFPDICPVTLAEMKKIDEKTYFCDYCKSEIKLVDNIDDLMKYENYCKAISNDALKEHINVDLEKVNKRLKFSKLFLVFEKLFPSKMEEFKKSVKDRYELLIKILDFIVDEELVDKFKKEVDLDFIMETAFKEGAILDTYFVYKGDIKVEHITLE